MNSLHEGYAVVLEELEEAWDEIKVNPKRRDGAKVRDELIQVAAMAVRTVTDCLGAVRTDPEAVAKRQARMEPDAAQRLHLAMHGHTTGMH